MTTLDDRFQLWATWQVELELRLHLENTEVFAVGGLGYPN